MYPSPWLTRVISTRALAVIAGAPHQPATPRCLGEPLLRDANSGLAGGFARYRRHQDFIEKCLVRDLGIQAVAGMDIQWPVLGL